MRFPASKIEPDSLLVRFCPGDEPEYVGMTVARQIGDEVHLQGLVDQCLTLSEWRAAAAEHFPTAKFVVFTRRNRGVEREVRLRIWPETN